MKQIYAVFIILGLGISLIVFLVLTEPEGETIAPERPVANVETITVERKTVQLKVDSQGTVLPEIEIDLPVEVSGRIIEMSDSFKPGKQVKSGEILFRIDPADYEALFAARQAEVARAELTLAQEEALAKQAVADWEAFGNRLEEASPLTLRRPQITQAKAALASARANLKQAKRDLEQTEVRAPFDGFILSKNVDFGQYIVGTPTGNAGRIFSSGSAEVRLPLSDQELALIGNLSEGERSVRLFADGDREWRGKLIRIEATVDPATRLNYAVAQIESPFGGEQPIRRGLFVRAEILGRSVADTIQLPRYALRGSDSVYIMTPEGQLRVRKVSVLQSDELRIVIDEGLITGEKVVTSPIAFFVEGMPVIEVVDE
ncbi:MAG: efflux RND transporter periplasmic adaptor subunit [Verrucomicrobiota bacterium]